MPPQHVVAGVVPYVVVGTNVVVHRGTVVRLVVVSELTQPTYPAVTVGTGSPYVTEGLDAVTVKSFVWIVIEPAT